MKKINKPSVLKMNKNTDIKMISKEKVLVKNMYIKPIIKFLYIIAFIIFLVFTYISFKSKNMSEYFSFWSDAFKDLIYCILGETLVSFLANYIFRKHMRWLINIVTPFLIIFFSLSGIFKIVSLKIKNESTIKEGEDTIKENDIQPESELVYYKVPYYFEGDPFFENKEEYFGVKKGSLTDEQIIQYMADTIQEDMKTQESEYLDISEAYIQYVQAADLEYRTYLEQRKRDWYRENSYSEEYITRKRIDDLNCAKEQRIKADDEYKNSENRRIIAIYYKDSGDEYAKNNNPQDAATDFEESAKWAMKSIYTAFINENYEKMKEAFKILNNAVEALDKLKDISDNRKNNLIKSRDAYKIIIDEYVNP